MIASDQRWPTSSNPSDTTKFPDFDPNISSRDYLTIYEEGSAEQYPDSRSSINSSAWGRANGTLHSERRTTRKDNTYSWGNGYANGTSRGHNRQKSLSDAIRTIRTRKGSVTANAQELAAALKAPVSFRLIVLCLIWYFSSALTNTSSKSILNAYPKPITLTMVQFVFVSLWCVFFAYTASISSAIRSAVPALRHGIRPPTRDVLATTLPLALFQLGGHVLSSTATEKIPVSLVHTIKGLSPLFTVLAYRFIYNIHYTTSTYLSLIPLTLGVILACSVEFSGNISGIMCAFVAAIIFVTQNIFSKKLFNDAARAEGDALPPSQAHPKKLDKLNLLCYCSGLAFLLTFPLWLWVDGLPLIADLYTSGSVSLSNKPYALDHGRLSLEFLFNGAFHFGQNIIAFVLLSVVSPVTYSVASLIKRVFVIVIAIIWFRSPTTRIQAVGIALTFLGLYLYDRTHDAARSAKNIHQSRDQPLLPLNTDLRSSPNALFETPVGMTSGQAYSGASGFSNEEKRSDSAGPGRPRIGSRAERLPVGIRSEEILRPREAGILI